LLADDADDEDALLLHGQVRLHMGEFADAKKMFERALELYPHSEDASTLLDLASSQLGQGDNSALKTYIEEVAVPAAVQHAIDQASGGDFTSGHEDQPAEEIVRVTGLFYEQGKPLRRTTLRRIKVHTEGGVAKYSTLKFSYTPNAERVYVNRLVVLDEHGAHVAEGSVDSYFVVDDTSSGMATSKKVINLPVPALKPGYTIECAVTREDQFPAKKFPFTQMILSSDVPVRVGAFFVQGEVADLKWASSRPADVKLENGALYCVQADPPRFRQEENQPSPDSFLSIVWIGDSKVSWATEAKDYLALIGDKLVDDEQTRELACELTKNCTNRWERLAAIAAHVQQAYTYRAIEFGRRGEIPNAAAQTIQLKYGDCKDHSVLLQQLLASAGIESHLALVKCTGAPVQDLPSLDQFDHMVVYVPGTAADIPSEAAEGIIIDATKKHADALLSPPCGMADTAVFVLDPKNPRFIQTPAHATGEVAIERQITLRVDDAAAESVAANVVETVTFNAYAAPQVRGFLKHFESNERRAALQDLLETKNEVRITRLDAKNLDKLSEPLCLTIEYEAADMFHSLDVGTDERSLVGRLPCAWESQYLDAEELDLRETPFQIEVPVLIRSSIKVHSPPGFALVGLDRRTGTGETKFVTWKCECSRHGNEVALNYEFHVAAGRHEAADYTPYCAAMKRSRSTLQAPITMREGAVETAQRAVRKSQ
jgi:hypothetical protein